MQMYVLFCLTILSNILFNGFLTENGFENLLSKFLVL